MNFTKIGRLLVCFLLVCCLIVNVSPIRANAVAAEAVIVGAAAASVVAAILAGLGVSAGSDTSVFNGVVNDILSNALFDFVSEGLINICKYYRSDGTLAFSIPLGLVETVRNYLFTNEIVRDTSPTFTTSECTGIFAGTTRRFSMDVPFTVYSVCLFDGTYYYPHLFICATDTTDYYYSGSSKFPFAGNVNCVLVDGYYLCSIASWGSHSSPDSYYSDVRDWADLGVVSVPSGTTFKDFLSSLSKDYLLGGVVSNSDLTLGEIASPTVPFADAYADWNADAITVPPSVTGTDEDVIYVPIIIVESDVVENTPEETTPNEETNKDKPYVPELTKIWESVNSVKDAIVSLPGTIVGAIEDIGIKLQSVWEWLTTTLGALIETIIGILSDILAWALGLVDAFVVALEALLTKIFVPDIAVIESAVADLRAQFPFFDSIIVTGQYLLNGITSGSPPVIYMHLQDAEGTLNWGGTVAVLDMSFYSRYKPAGDLIMSSALITIFAWRTFKRLPGIISGAGSDIQVFKET